MPPPRALVFPMNLQLATVGLLLTLLMPPPTVAVPLVMVKPSIRVSWVAPEGEVTTLPASLPSKVVMLVAQLRCVRLVSLPANPP